MRILGIDPGTRIVGYGIVENVKGQLVAYDYGAIVVKAKMPLAQRLRQIYSELVQVITKNNPQAAAIEKVFYGKNLQSAIRIGEGRGVAMLAAANANMPVYEYDATTIKKSVTGSGGAHKTQVQAMIQAILNLPTMPNPSDASDALAIAVCHLHHFQANQVQAGQEEE